MKGESGCGDVVAFVDHSPVFDASGNYYQCTVRRVDCHILCDRSGQYPSRCKSCKAFRPTLCSSAARQTRDNHDHTSSSSHTKFCALTPAEKDDRMKNLH